ncbi:MAG TPA: NUDIX hydrolase [Desulfobacteraceae bacterium]|nr:NUDIX hydrolase [Desulfobacteraceae bacterium]
MKICSKEQITNHKFLNLVSVAYQDRNGADKSWIYATRGQDACPDAVVIVPYHPDTGKLVLIREFRVPLNGDQIGFPAGLVDPGESVEAAGIRELHEETGLEVRRVLKESPPVYSSSGMTDESISMLYVEAQGDPTTRFNEGSEQIDVLLRSQEEVLEMLEDKTLMFDVKTWIVLDRFADTGRVT